LRLLTLNVSAASLVVGGKLGLSFLELLVAGLKRGDGLIDEGLLHEERAVKIRQTKVRMKHH